MRYRRLCKGAWQKSPETRSALGLALSRYTVFHNLRYGIGVKDGSLSRDNDDRLVYYGCALEGLGMGECYVRTWMPTRSNNSPLISARCLMGMRPGMLCESEPVLSSRLCLLTYSR